MKMRRGLPMPIVHARLSSYAHPRTGPARVAASGRAGCWARPAADRVEGVCGAFRANAATMRGENSNTVPRGG